MEIKVKINKIYSHGKKGTVVKQSIAAGTQVKKQSLLPLSVSKGEKPPKAVQTAAPAKAPVAVTARPKATKKPQKYDASLDGYLQ